MKQKLKLRNVFSLLLLVLLFGCTEEKDYIEKSNGISLRKISFTEFQKNATALRTYNAIENKRKMATAEGRIIYDSINNFSIDTDKIVVAEKDGKVTFTILIERPYETLITENLVLEQAENGAFIPYIFQYDLNEIDKEKAMNCELMSDIFSKLTILKPEDLHLEDFLPLANRTTICITVSQLGCTCHTKEHTANTEAGLIAQGCTSQCIGSIDSTICYSDYGGGGGNSNIPTFGNPGGNYPNWGSTGSNGGNGGAYTSNPIPPPPPPPNNNSANQNQINTLPLVDDVEDEPTVTKTPCEHLNDLMTVTGVQTQIQTLKPLSNGLDEHGFFVKNGIHNVNGTNVSGSYTETIPSNPNDPHHLSLDGPNGLKTGKVITAVHCHTSPSLNGGTRMFSPGDVSKLHSIAGYHVNLKSQKDFSAYSVLLVSSFGTFAIKFDSQEAYQNFWGFFQDFEKLLDKRLRKTNEYTSENKLVNIFLKTMIDTSLMGISLFKANEITQNNNTSIASWNKLVLDESNNSNPPIAIPCF